MIKKIYNFAIEVVCKLKFRFVGNFVGMRSRVNKSTKFEGRCVIYEADVRFSEIGFGSYVGSGVTIFGGVTIGDGAVIGTGAVVTKDVLPYSVVAGVPAKIIKFRFDEHTVEKLMKIKWWDWNIELMSKSCFLFGDVQRFIDAYSCED